MEETINQGDIKFDDKLDNFLKGRMTPEEEKEFKKELNDNAELKTKAIATAHLIKAMEEVGDQEDTEVINEIENLNSREINKFVENAIYQVKSSTNDKTTINKFKVFKTTLISLSSAAVILLCIFGGLKMHQYSLTTQLGREGISYYSPSEFMRGEEEKVAEELSVIYGDLKEKRNIETSILKLENFWTEANKEEYNDYTEYKTEIGWYLANAYLMDNDRKKALQILEALQVDTEADSVIGKDIQNLIKEIRDV